MVIFFNIPNNMVAITLHIKNPLMALCLHVTNALMVICLHARNARMRASMQDTIFPCNEMKETFLRV